MIEKHIRIINKISNWFTLYFVAILLDIFFVLLLLGIQLHHPIKSIKMYFDGKFYISVGSAIMVLWCISKIDVVIKNSVDVVFAQPIPLLSTNDP